MHVAQSFKYRVEIQFWVDTMVAMLHIERNVLHDEVLGLILSLFYFLFLFYLFIVNLSISESHERRSLVRCELIG